MDDDTQHTKRDLQGLISDTMADFFYYDRKEDEEWPRGEIERMVETGVVSYEEMVQMFAEELRSALDTKQ